MAKTSFDCVPAKGRPFRLVVRIGAPVKVLGTPYPEAFVPLEMPPLIPTTRIRQTDAFYALCQTFTFLRMVLRAFIRDGGRIFAPGTRSPIDVESDHFFPVLSLSELQKHAVPRKTKRLGTKSTGKVRKR